MRALILGLAAGTVAFAGSSIYLWQQLDVEREHAAQVEKSAQDLKTRIGELEKARNELAQRRVASPAGFVSGSFRSGETAVLPPSVAPKAREPDQPVWTVQRQEPSPAMKKMMRNQMRGSNKRLYAEVGDKLRLNKDTTNKLIDLLTEQQAAGMNFFVPGDDPAEAARHSEQVMRDNEMAINDLIGPDKAMALKEYQETIPARMDVENLVRQLENNEVQVSEEQRKKLVDIYIEERARVPHPVPYDGVEPEAYGKSMMAWQDDYEKRVSAEAGRVLDSSQLAAYNEILQWHKEMRAQFPVMSGRGTMQLRRDVALGNATPFATAAPGVSVTVEAVSSEQPARRQKTP